MGNSAIFADTLAEIQSEATRIKKDRPSERKPSAAKVIDLAWGAYKTSPKLADLPDYDKSLIAEVVEMIKDSNGGYRASVADMVKAWRTGSKSTKKLAVATTKATPKEKVRRA